MADDFQALIERINEEGLKKAEAEKARILEDARKEASSIIAKAQETADNIVHEAERSADNLKKKGEESLKQASRAVLLELRETLSQRVESTVSGLMKETMDTSRLPAIIGAVCTSYLEKNGSSDDLKVLLNAAQYDELSKAVRASLGQSLAKHVELAPSEQVRGGFKLAFKGSDVQYDFSDAALAEAISAHLGPAISAAIAE